MGRMVYITSRFILISINFGYLLFGIFLLAFGLRETLRNKTDHPDYSAGIEVGAFTLIIGLLGLFATYFNRRWLSIMFIFLLCGSILFKFALVCYTPIVGDIYYSNYTKSYVPYSSSILSVFIIIDIAAVILTVYLLSEKEEYEASYKLNNI
jgi:hypothetical protein